MIAVRQLRCVREGRVVLDDISFAVKAGEFIGVLGANGAGKSSLLAALAGDLPLQTGDITLNGVALKQLTQRQLARQRALLPQSPTLAFDLPVPEVVAMGAYPFEDLAAAQIEELITQALALADAADLAGRHYAGLSGGEQQRVQFARVLLQILAASPSTERLLLLDEPTSSLDPKHQHGLLSAVRELAQREQLAVLVVLHDVNLAARWCDRLLLLNDGKMLADGKPAEVLTAQNMHALYGMSADVLEYPPGSGRQLVLFG
ncbi:heme ABC transporter ATP-binding protein [Silvimonas soli]|uniref:heme ABC transporter ATP-binding protein n=1 Tax=Silvimonas soli TaxID=2980100 RepID=UPI0024B34C2E|nr:heme ABC transporter ATP-binding protein [Silvimonas soli]